MRYHNITYPDMNNGSGLRVVLWLSGCSHRCFKCQNPQTWDVNSGIPFDESAENELFEVLSKDYISGITLTGGDPLHENNLNDVLDLVNEICLLFGEEKTIWLYSGYTFEETQTVLKGISPDCIEYNWQNQIRQKIISMCDVMIDGRYIDDLRDISLKWRGSINQRCINIQETLKWGKIVLYCD